VPRGERAAAILALRLWKDAELEIIRERHTALRHGGRVEREKRRRSGEPTRAGSSRP
jgi:hypothetical protein